MIVKIYFKRSVRKLWRNYYFYCSLSYCLWLVIELFFVLGIVTFQNTNIPFHSHIYVYNFTASKLQTLHWYSHTDWQEIAKSTLDLIPFFDFCMNYLDVSVSSLFLWSWKCFTELLGSILNFHSIFWLKLKLSNKMTLFIYFTH